jgi:hypothetical protein
MKFGDILSEIIIQDKIPDFDVDAIVEALLSNSPEDGLYEVFEDEWYPKIYRWLEEKLKNVKPTLEWKEKKISEFHAKLATYLEIDTNDSIDNAKILAREIINSYEDWNEYDVKIKDLPKPKI